MKTIAHLLLFVLRRPTRGPRWTSRTKRFASIAALAGAVVAASAQYSINWFKVAGGGGASSGGPFALSGTVGQHDASGAMTGGGYSVSGGFWVLPGVVQEAGAPILRIAPASPGQATISWTPATPGWVLQEVPEVTGA